MTRSSDKRLVYQSFETHRGEGVPASAGGRLQQFSQSNREIHFEEIIVENAKPQHSSKKLNHRRIQTYDGIKKAVSKVLGVNQSDNQTNNLPKGNVWNSNRSDPVNGRMHSEMGVKLAYLKPSHKSSEPEFIYEKDIEMPNEEGNEKQRSATEVVVQSHRKMVRVKRSHSSKISHLARRNSNVQRRIRFGKPLIETPDNDEYLLTLGMMVGLRVAVGRQENPKAKNDLTISDFYMVDKYVFPPSGALGIMVTPPHKLGHTFKFKDYAPKVFKRLRSHFGVDKMRYMLSVAGNYNYLDFITNAKSGEFFFFSHDENFMIKTMKRQETKFLRRILPHYYEHVRKHSDTLLVRFCGMYRVKMHHINRKVHFMVMSSVFDTHNEMHTIYDLKGSTVGRMKKENEMVGKDIDLVKNGNKIHLGGQKKTFLDIVQQDVAFLARMNIMDYSLLLGIHDKSLMQENLSICRPHYTKFLSVFDENEIFGSHNLDRASDVSQDDLPTRNNGSNSRRRVGLNKVNDLNSNRTKSPFWNSSHGELFSSGSESSFENGKKREGGEGRKNVKEGDGKGLGLPPVPPSKKNLSHSLPAGLKLKNGIALNESKPRSPMPECGSENFEEEDSSSDKEQKEFPSLKRRVDFGIRSQVGFDGDFKPGNEIYYMGIIDILQEYNMRKHAETLVKSKFLGQNKSQISCIDPKHYAERFLNFLREQTD